jgi:large subunit ribosomal protein L19
MRRISFGIDDRTKPMSQDLIKSLEAVDNPNIPTLSSGDSVKVHVRIIEGDRERIQVFPGTIIRMRKGGNDASITVRRTASGVGVERTFLLRSPRIERIEVVRNARVRRAQLFFLRNRTGRSATLREKR